MVGNSVTSKASNDAILQIVSVFAIGYNKQFAMLSGADASITNSNSNFGQLALVGEGFKAEAFDKDNKAFITSIITPKAVTEHLKEVDWLRVDVGVTTNVGITSHLYLLGYNDENVLPPTVTQGLGLVHRKQELLHKVKTSLEIDCSLTSSDITGYATSEAQIFMSDKTTTGSQTYDVTAGPTT